MLSAAGRAYASIHSDYRRHRSPLTDAQRGPRSELRHYYTGDRRPWRNYRYGDGKCDTGDHSVNREAGRRAHPLDDFQPVGNSHAIADNYVLTNRLREHADGDRTKGDANLRA